MLNTDNPVSVITPSLVVAHGPGGQSVMLVEGISHPTYSIIWGYGLDRTISFADDRCTRRCATAFSAVPLAACTR